MRKSIIKLQGTTPIKVVYIGDSYFKDTGKVFFKIAHQINASILFKSPMWALCSAGIFLAIYTPHFMRG